MRARDKWTPGTACLYPRSPQETNNLTLAGIPRTQKAGASLCTDRECLLQVDSKENCNLMTLDFASQIREFVIGICIKLCYIP